MGPVCSRSEDCVLHAHAGTPSNRWTTKRATMLSHFSEAPPSVSHYRSLGHLLSHRRRDRSDGEVGTAERRCIAQATARWCFMLRHAKSLGNHGTAVTSNPTSAQCKIFLFRKCTGGRRRDGACSPDPGGPRSAPRSAPSRASGSAVPQICHISIHHH